MKRPKFIDFVTQDLLPEMGGLSVRAMFGAFGLYKDGMIFGLIDEDQLYFKVDRTNQKEYEERGSRPLTYRSSRGKLVKLPYWEVPAEIMDDREEILRWARLSYQIGSRQAADRKKTADRLDRFAGKRKK